MLRIARVIGALVAFGLILYVAVFLHAAHGDSVKFVTAAVRQSKAVQEYVGAVRDVRLSPGGPYGEESQGDVKTARVTLDVQGTIRSATVTADASFSKGTWKLDNLIVDGRRLPLD